MVLIKDYLYLFKDDVTLFSSSFLRDFMFVVGLDEEEDRRERKTSQKV
jgi:hypothetical protein